MAERRRPDELFVIVPLAAKCDDRLRPNARRLLDFAYFSAATRGKGRSIAMLSIADYQALMGCGRTVVTDAIAELKEHGWVESAHQPGRGRALALRILPPPQKALDALHAKLRRINGGAEKGPDSPDGNDTENIQTVRTVSSEKGPDTPDDMVRTVRTPMKDSRICPSDRSRSMGARDAPAAAPPERDPPATAPIPDDHVPTFGEWRQWLVNDLSWHTDRAMSVPVAKMLRAWVDAQATVGEARMAVDAAHGKNATPSSPGYYRPFMQEVLDYRHRGDRDEARPHHRPGRPRSAVERVQQRLGTYWPSQRPDDGPDDPGAVIIDTSIIPD